MSDPSVLVAGIAIEVALIAGYFLPTIVAFARKRPNRVPLAIINVVCGWTIVGWFACLAWAFAA